MKKHLDERIQKLAKPYLEEFDRHIADLQKPSPSGRRVAPPHLHATTTFQDLIAHTYKEKK